MPVVYERSLRIKSDSALATFITSEENTFKQTIPLNALEIPKYFLVIVEDTLD